MLGQCLAIASSIEERIGGPEPPPENKKESPIQGLSALTLELNNRARRLRERLEIIANALA